MRKGPDKPCVRAGVLTAPSSSSGAVTGATRRRRLCTGSWSQTAAVRSIMINCMDFLFPDARAYEDEVDACSGNPTI